MQGAHVSRQSASLGNFANVGIRYPGLVNDSLIRLTVPRFDDPDRHSELLERIPMGRMGTADEIAYGMLYLASDESAFVTGSELVIDGGVTAQ